MVSGMLALTQNSWVQEGGPTSSPVQSRVMERGSSVACFIGFNARDLWTNGGHIPESNQYKGVHLLKIAPFFCFSRQRKCYMVEIQHIFRVKFQLLLTGKIIFYIFNGILHSQIMNLNYILHFAEKGNLFARRWYTFRVFGRQLRVDKW